MRLGGGVPRSVSWSDVSGVVVKSSTKDASTVSSKMPRATSMLPWACLALISASRMSGLCSRAERTASMSDSWEASSAAREGNGARMIAKAKPAQSGCRTAVIRMPRQPRVNAQGVPDRNSWS